MAGKKKKRGEKPSVVEWSSSTSVVWVEDGGIRKKLATSLKRARTYYKKAQSEWEQYQNEFLPGYHAWLQRVEGDSSMQISGLQRHYQYRYMILSQTDTYSFRYNISPSEAFARVMDVIENPDKYPQAKDFDMGEDSDGGEDDGFEFDLDDESEDATDYDEKMDRELYDTLFQEGAALAPMRRFLDDVLGLDSSEMTDAMVREIRQSMRENMEQRYGWGSHPSEDVAGTIKKKYREIAKHLHPDRGGEFDEATRRLWLEVQAAYERSDEDYLDVVLARIRLGADDPGEQTCWDLQSAVAFYRSSLKSLRKTLTREKRSEAWQFAQLDGDEKMHLAATIRMEIQQDLSDAKQVVAEVDAEFADLEKDRGMFDPEEFRKDEWELLAAKKKAMDGEVRDEAEVVEEFLDELFGGRGEPEGRQGSFDFF